MRKPPQPRGALIMTAWCSIERRHRLCESAQRIKRIRASWPRALADREPGHTVLCLLMNSHLLAHI
jgi:hypothetical protein